MKSTYIVMLILGLVLQSCCIYRESDDRSNSHQKKALSKDSLKINILTDTIIFINDSLTVPFPGFDDEFNIDTNNIAIPSCLDSWGWEKGSLHLHSFPMCYKGKILYPQDIRWLMNWLQKYKSKYTYPKYHYCARQTTIYYFEKELLREETEEYVQDKIETQITLSKKIITKRYCDYRIVIQDPQLYFKNPKSDHPISYKVYYVYTIEGNLIKKLYSPLIDIIDGEYKKIDIPILDVQNCNSENI